MGADSDADKAILNFKEHLEWRRAMNVNMLLDSEEVREDQIRSYFPNTFHHADTEGRPLWLIQLGTAKLSELFQACSKQAFTKYLVREMEHSWREKMPLTGGDQITVLIDMKGATLK